MSLEAARLVVISTKFSHRPFVGGLEVGNDTNEEEDPELEENVLGNNGPNQDPGPRFTVKASTYDFWNLVET